MKRRLVIIIISIFLVIYFTNLYAKGQTVIADWLGTPEEQTVDEPVKKGDSDLVEDKPEKIPYLERTVEVTVDGKVVVNNPDGLLVLVNKKRNLPSDYAPEDLVIPNVLFPFKEKLEKKYLRKEAALALEQLFQRASQDNVKLYALSGYRSYKRQEEIFNYKAQQRGEEVANQTSARPGQSEHQTGLAMDVTSSSVNYKLVESFGETKEGQWLVGHAADFGFVIRYPQGKEDITGYNYEPWHLRYVGKEMAGKVNTLGITLEEYFRDYI